MPTERCSSRSRWRAAPSAAPRWSVASSAASSARSSSSECEFDGTRGRARRPMTSEPTGWSGSSSALTLRRSFAKENRFMEAAGAMESRRRALRRRLRCSAARVTTLRSARSASPSAPSRWRCARATRTPPPRRWRRASPGCRRSSQIARRAEGEAVMADLSNEKFSRTRCQCLRLRKLRPRSRPRAASDDRALEDEVDLVALSLRAIDRLPVEAARGDVRRGPIHEGDRLFSASAGCRRARRAR